MGRGRHHKTTELLAACLAILEEIQPCSVRAVAYRLFTMGKIESMGEVAKVSRILTLGREEGVIPWEWIVDETRELEQVEQWRDTAQYLRVFKRSYRKDHWALQPTHVEVWSEKGTVRGTVEPVLDEFGVGFRVLHGWASATVVHSIATEEEASAKPWIIFYIGDFDPSGLYMSEVDLPDRLMQYGTGAIEIRRIALTIADVSQQSEQELPSFALKTKRQDPRYTWYTRATSMLGRRQGRRQGRCWEVDALSPTILRARLASEIERVIEPVQWARSVLAETAEKDSIQAWGDGRNSL